MMGRSSVCNGVRTLSVFCRGNPGDQPERYAETDRASHGKPYLPDLAEGVTYEYGGAKELDFETMNPLMQGLAIAVIIVFFFLLVNFKKIGLALAALSSLLAHLVRGGAGLVGVPYRFQLDVRLGRY